MTRRSGATERVGVPTRYRVKGALSFPIDMLRYDSAWPASEADSGTIERTLRHEHEGVAVVTVYSRLPLTVGRWRSFGWIVEGVAP